MKKYLSLNITQPGKLILFSALMLAFVSECKKDVVNLFNDKALAKPKSSGQKIIMSNHSGPQKTSLWASVPK